MAMSVDERTARKRARQTARYAILYRDLVLAHAAYKRAERALEVQRKLLGD